MVAAGGKVLPAGVRCWAADAEHNEPGGHNIRVCCEREGGLGALGRPGELPLHFIIALTLFVQYINYIHVLCYKLNNRKIIQMLLSFIGHMCVCYEVDRG